MVSFNCDSCGDVVTKGKLKNHAMRCRVRTLSCLDCSRTFNWPSPELDAHTTCISEAEKYQGKLYNANKKKRGNNNNNNNNNGNKGEVNNNNVNNNNNNDAEGSSSKKAKPEEQQQQQQEQQQEQQQHQQDQPSGLTVSISSAHAAQLFSAAGKRSARLDRLTDDALQSQHVRDAIKAALHDALLQADKEGKLRYKNNKAKRPK